SAMAPTLPLGLLEPLGRVGGLGARPPDSSVGPHDAGLGGNASSVLLLEGRLCVMLRPLGSAQLLFLAAERDDSQRSDGKCLADHSHVRLPDVRTRTKRTGTNYPYDRNGNP